jgi:hypothetical protein
VAYASSGSRSNHSGMTRAASSTPYLAAPVNPSMGPCTVGSREMPGPQLQKRMSMWSTTACARAQPSSSKRLLMASSS